MAHYLVVAHRIAPNELASCLRHIEAGDPASACTLLVTATHWTRPMSGQTPTLEALAIERGAEARALLRDSGLHLVTTIAGDGSAPTAVEDEIRFHPEHYDAVVLCTPRRRGVQAWVMDGDLRTRIQERVPLPVFHMFEGTSAPWGRRPDPRIGWLSRLWARTRLVSDGQALVATPRALMPFVVLMAVYLVGGLTLAIFVNRGFLLNDLVALLVYGLVIGGLLFVLRHET